MRGRINITAISARLFLILALFVNGCGGNGSSSVSTSGPNPNPDIVQPNSWPEYNEAESYLLPYASDSSGKVCPHPPNFGQPRLALCANIRVSVTGNGTGPLTPQLDTGSRGLWFTRNYLPPDTIITGIPGSITCNSSGNEQVGTWTTAQVTFPDATPSGGAPPTATATLLVLVVDYLTCQVGVHPNATCTPQDARRLWAVGT